MKIFMNFTQKIAEYCDDEENNFVIWANKPGLQNFSDVIANHARKCNQKITPCFNGFKVIFDLCYFKLRNFGRVSHSNFGPPIFLNNDIK